MRELEELLQNTRWELTEVWVQAAASGNTLKVEPVEFAAGLDVVVRERKEARMIAFLAWVTGYNGAAIYISKDE